MFMKVFFVCYNWEFNFENLWYFIFFYWFLFGGVVCCFSMMYVSRFIWYWYFIVNKWFFVIYLVNELMFYFFIFDFEYVVVFIINSYRCVFLNIGGFCWEKIDIGLEKMMKVIFIFVVFMINVMNDYYF